MICGTANTKVEKFFNRIFMVNIRPGLGWKSMKAGLVFNDIERNNPEGIFHLGEWSDVLNRYNRNTITKEWKRNQQQF